MRHLFKLLVDMFLLDRCFLANCNRCNNSKPVRELFLSAFGSMFCEHGKHYQLCTTAAKTCACGKLANAGQRCHYILRPCSTVLRWG
jgi:hypothetical protein